MILNSFNLHETHGLHLSQQIMICYGGKIPISLAIFFVDAYCGWGGYKALSVIKDALIENGKLNEFYEIKQKIILLWSLAKHYVGTDDDKIQKFMKGYLLNEIKL